MYRQMDFLRPEKQSEKKKQPGRKERPLLTGYSCAFGKLLGTAAEFTFEGLEKVGIIVKAAFHARFHHRRAFPNHVARHGDALFDNELIQGQTGIGLELVRQMGLADKAGFG